jgi:hypothetical protein
MRKEKKITRNFDLSALFLIVSNVITIVIAVLEQWQLSEVIWIYWWQNIIIGFYNYKRIRSLKHFSAEGFTINKKPVAPTKATQGFVAIFFLLHFGFFHLVYLIFIMIEGAALPKLNSVGFVSCLVVFIINHHFSFRHNLEKDLQKKPHIGTIMLFPYARIIPMHLIILIGGFFAGASPALLVIFLVLKTYADLFMHRIEHSDKYRIWLKDKSVKNT